MESMMGTYLWSRDYREVAQTHANRVPIVCSGADACVCHKTALGSASLRKQVCGISHFLLREHTSFLSKSFLRGH